jgi:hypothetical protein
MTTASKIRRMNKISLQAKRFPVIMGATYKPAYLLENRIKSLEGYSLTFGSLPPRATVPGLSVEKNDEQCFQEVRH